MFLLSTLALPVLQTFASDSLSSLGMIIHFSHHTFLHNPTLSASFLFHPWQICHATMEEHFLLAPNFHLFFHRPNIPRKWKFSFTMAITTSKPEELCIIQTIITVISFLTLLLCSIGQHICLCRKPRYLNILVSQMTVLLVFWFLFLRMSEYVKPIKNPAWLLFRWNVLDGMTLLKLVNDVMF